MQIKTFTPTHIERLRGMGVTPEHVAQVLAKMGYPVETPKAPDVHARSAEKDADIPRLASGGSIMKDYGKDSSRTASESDIEESLKQESDPTFGSSWQPSLSDPVLQSLAYNPNQPMVSPAEMSAASTGAPQQQFVSMPQPQNVQMANQVQRGMPTAVDPMGAMRAARQVGQAESAQAQAVGGQYQQAAQQMQTQREAYQQQFGQWQQQMHDARQKASINPVSEWSTGQKVQAGIAAILGGIGAGLTKGPNLGIQAINDSINREMQLRQNEVKNLAQQFGDWNMAQSAMRTNLMQEVQSQIMATTQNSSSQVVRAKGEQAAQMIQLKANEFNTEMGIKSLAQKQSQQSQNVEKLFTDPRTQQVYQFGTKDDAEKAKAMAQGYLNVKDSVNGLLKMSQEGRGIPWGERQSKAEALQQQAIRNAQDFVNTGVLQEHEMKEFKSMFPNPTEWLQNPDNSKTKLSQALGWLEHRMDNRIRSLGGGIMANQGAPGGNAQNVFQYVSNPGR